MPQPNLLGAVAGVPFDKLRVWYKQFYNPRARAEDFQKRVNGHYVTRGTQNAPWDQVASHCDIFAPR